MKPADITLDMVRDAMERSAAWYERGAEAHGHYATPDNVVWYVHGFDGSIRNREGYDAMLKAREQVRSKLGWANHELREASSAQMAVVRGHLATLVEQGLVEQSSPRGARTYAWITDAMRAARERAAAQHAQLVELRERLYAALGGTPAAHAHALEVHTKLKPRMHERGVFDAQVTITLDVALAEKLFSAVGTKLLSDYSCKNCGDDPHEGACERHVCSECGHEVASRCSQHPNASVNVYRQPSS